MPHDCPIVKTSLAVGFGTKGLPEAFLCHRGRDHRSVPLTPEFPYEDAQFEVVMLDGAAVSRASVREAHRVLRPEGHLYFIVPEKTRSQVGFTMPDIYSIVRDGFSIVGLERPAWWRFGRNGRTLTIAARKQTWRTYRGLGRGEIVTHSLFARSK